MFDPFELIFVQRGVLEIAALVDRRGPDRDMDRPARARVLRARGRHRGVPGPRARRGAGLLGRTSGPAAPRSASPGSVGWLARRDRTPLRQRHGARARRRAGARRDPRQRRLSLGLQRRDAAVRQPARDQRRRHLVRGRGQRDRARRVARCSSSAGWRRDSIPTRARALGARSALPDLRRCSASSRSSRSRRCRPSARCWRRRCSSSRPRRRGCCARGCAAWQLATVALVLLEGVAGLWLVGAAQRAARRRRSPCSARPCSRSSRRRAPRRGAGVRRALAAAAALLLALGGAGCGSSDARPAASGASNAVRVVATTTQLGDIVRNVGGDGVDVTQILKPNSDPHDYEPRPRDVQDTAGAKLVFASGDGLDAWIGDVVSQSGGDPTVVDRRRRGQRQARRRAQRPGGLAVRPALVARPAQRRAGDRRHPRRARAGRPERPQRATSATRPRYLRARAQRWTRGIARVLRPRAALAAQARHRPRRVRLLRQALRHRRGRRRDPVADDRRRSRRRATSPSSAR